MIKNILKGFIIGIGKIIPGVSGALLAITLGVYDKALNAITNFFDNKKENTKLLITLAIGIILAILIFSKIINYALTKYFLITMLFFIGLIIGGIPNILKKVKTKNWYIILISFSIIFLLTITQIDNNYILKNNFSDYLILVFAGFLEALGTVVPGISSTALLMIVGMYNLIINAISNLIDFNLIITNIKIIIPFGIGLLIGLIAISIIINYLLNKHSEKTYSFVLGVTIASVLLLIIKTFSSSFTIISLMIGIIFLILGVIISLLLDK